MKFFKNIGDCIKNLLLTVYWAIFAAFFATLLAVWLAPKLSNPVSKVLFFLMDHQVLLDVCLVLLVLPAVKCMQVFRHQKIRNQNSYILFLYFGLALVALFFTYKFFYNVASNQCFFEFLIAIAGAFVFFWNLLDFFPKKISPIKSFAPESVGLEQDDLGFKESAKSVAQGLIDHDEYVSVHVLYGDMGHGKSSYLRMIVESIEQRIKHDKFLYTYISLTETNAAKDFSQLFADRWFKTLQERYPFIQTVHIASLLTIIFKEFNSNGLSMLREILAKINRPLYKTKVKVFDKFLGGSKPEYVEREVARMFANIPSLDEDLWVIAIEEVERSKLDEVYRLVEAIERFKYQGRTGLPIRIVFLISLSREDFRKTINIYKDSIEVANLLDNFFFLDPKHFTQALFLPPISYEKKIEFVKNNAKSFTNIFNINVEEFDSLQPDLAPLLTSFERDTKKSFGMGMRFLVNESPRLIKRCFSELTFFYQAFRNTSKDQYKIFWGDVLLLSFIRIRYPFLIEFFGKTVDLIMPDKNSMSSIYLRKELNEKKILDWVVSVFPAINEKLSDQDRQTIEDLFKLVAYRWIEFLGSNNMNEAIYFYDDESMKEMRRTSNPFVMNLYLKLHDEDKSSLYKQFLENKELFEKHQGNNLSLDSISDLNKLLIYEDFVRYMKSFSFEKHLEMAKEFLRRLSAGLVPLDPRNCNFGASIYDKVVYAFVYEFSEALAKIRSEDQEEKKKKAFNLLKEFFEGESITSGAKLIVLQYIEGEINQPVGWPLSGFVKELDFEKIFAELDKRYLDGDKSIYEEEENFFFLLYQRWSGDLKSPEVEKIQRAIRKDLYRYPDAIALHWMRYQYQSGWATINDVESDGFNSVFVSHDRPTLFISLPDLLEETQKMLNQNGKLDENIEPIYQFWKSVWDENPEQCNEKLKVSSSEDTLYYKLKVKDKGLLNSE